MSSQRITDLLSIENPNFIPFKRNIKLHNYIFSSKNLYECTYTIYSTSKSKNKLVCNFTIDNVYCNPGIEKIENILKTYTWNLGNKNLSTTENSIKKSFRELLIKNNIENIFKLKFHSFTNSDHLMIILLKLFNNNIFSKNKGYSC